MEFRLTDQQQDFVAAIRDFCIASAARRTSASGSPMAATIYGATSEIQRNIVAKTLEP